MSSKNNRGLNKTSSKSLNAPKKKTSKKLFGKGAKERTSMLLVVVMVMALAVPVIIALFEFLGIYFR